GITYTNIPSATNSTLSGYVITEPTYFVCDVICMNGPDTVTSNPVFVDFANKILTTTPDTICGAGTATLQATATPGSTIHWYDAPTGGNLVGTGSPFTTPLINATTNYYVAAESTIPMVATIGTGTSSSTLAGYTPFYTYYKSSKNQILYRASELQAQGLSAGYITALSFNFSSVSTTPMTNFEIQMANTNVSALTTTYETGLTSVYTNPSYTPAGIGWQTIALSTPFYWDGTSNLLIQICDGENSSFSLSSGVYYSTTTYNSHHYGYMDNGTGCAMTNPTYNYVGSNRPNIRITIESICSSPRVEVTAAVGASTPITISNDTTVCNNTVATIKVIDGVASYTEFTWIPATNLYTDSACTIPYVAGASSDTVYMKTNVAGVYTYICAAYDTSTGCGSTDTISITVLPATVNLIANPASICFSGSTQLSVNPTTGFGTAIFQFAESSDSITFNNIPGATGFSYTTPTLNTTTYYRWTATVGANTCIEKVTSVVVNNPQITSLTNDTICGFGSAQLIASATSGSTINWYDAPTGGNLIHSGDTLTIPSINDTTVYYVQAVINGCQTPVIPDTVFVTPAPTVTITAMHPSICAGLWDTLTAQSVNSNYTYVWSNGYTGQMTAVNLTSSATFVVTATDANTGCVTTAEIDIDVYPLPTATATASNTNITCGQSVQLIAGDLYSQDVNSENFNGTTTVFTTVNTSTGGNPSAAAWTLRPDGYVYSSNTFHSNDNSQFIMSNSDAQGSGSTTHTELISPVFSSVGADSITLEMYHYYRHFTGDSAKVEIFDGTQWSTLQKWTATQGTPSNFAHVVLPLPNTYLNNPNLQIRFVYDATWDYYWAIDNVAVNLYHANTFSWTSTPVGFTSAIYNPTDAPSTTTQYNVVVTSVHGCTNTASVNVTVNNPPAPTVTVNNLCGESELTASNYTGTLNWSTGESTNTITVNDTNAVSVTYTFGACTSDAATVNPEPIEIPATPTVNSVSTCYGETVSAFTASSNYNNFVWYADSALTTAIGTGSTYQSQEVNVGTYTYYVVAMNGTCESDAAIATLTIHALPTVSITQNGDTLISSSSTGNQWYNTLGPIAGATDSIYIAESEDTYYVVVTDANGCSAMSNTIHVIPTSIAQNQFASMISLSPNPAHNYTVLNMGTIDNAKIEIVAVDGKVVYTDFVKNNNKTILLNDLASGLYTVKVTANGKTIQKKLVVE
ncbi:MAG: Ig-like domain-containing protein, partial [Bacteroidales bacterium]